MDEFATNPMEEDDLAQAPETPEDVAVLYTWANVHGGKYRDFSASRREYRAQQRHRMVEAQRQAELEAAREREEKAARELEEARLLESSADKAAVSPEEAEEIRRRAEERAEQERLAAQKHVETAEELRLALEQAEREMEEARRRAEEQAARYAEADARWRAQQRGMAEVVPGEINDPYYYAGPLEPSAFAPGRGVRSSVPQRVSSERRIVESYYRSRGESSAEIAARQEEARREDEEMGLFDTGGGYRSRHSSGAKPIYRETPPPPPPPMGMAEIRPETPEDTRERNRLDERNRGSAAAAEPEGRFDDNEDDDYYDRSFSRPSGSRPSAPPRSPADRNSAQSDLHIPPRPHHPRPSQESGERRIVRSEDPAPGNTHLLDQSSRSRRRESAADVLARTTRRPRAEEASHPQESRDLPAQAPRSRSRPEDSADYRSARRDESRLPDRSGEQRQASAGGEDRIPRDAVERERIDRDRSDRDRSGREDRPADFRPAADVRAPRPERTHYDDRAPQAPAVPPRAPREDAGGREERPEWLVRDTRAAADRSAAQQDREVEGRRRERDAFEEFLSRTGEPSPRSTDDRPARSAYMEREADTRRDDAGRDEPRRDEREARRDGEGAPPRRRSRPPVGLTREVPSILPDLAESQTVRAADGGFNLRPMRDRAPMDKLPPMRDRGTEFREESEERPAARSAPPPVKEPRREAASPRSESTRPRESEPRPESLPERPEIAATDAAWTRVERRRYDRSSGARGTESQLDSSREYRAAIRDAEQEEKSGRNRSQTARRDVDLREDFRNDTQAPLQRDTDKRGETEKRSEKPFDPRDRSDVRDRTDTRDRAETRDRTDAPRDRDVRPYVTSSPEGTPAGNTRSGGAAPSSAADTLQQSRERVAARWFALKGLMGANAEPAPEPPPPTRTAKETTAPMLSVVALSGGVGKTSLVATLGRALSSAGEKVLLADTTAHGLLPYYFGARELRPDVVRTFSPPPGSADAPVYMVNYETDRLAADEAGQAHLVEEIVRHAKGTQRVLLDLNGSSAWLARRLTRSNSSVLVPIAPDMNSVLSIQGVERFFAGTQDGEGRPVSPYYVLNQFDASLPLHLDVREVLRQQLGNRLLPVMIRRSQSVSEALAEGMTVIDYAPESPVTEDYTHLAEWVRNLAAPASTGLRSIRWSER